MGKKGVEELISEINIFIDGCKYQPLSNNKIVVPKDELQNMLDELRAKLPSEFERSKKIMRNREAILATARNRSDAIITESVNEANRLVDANHITELANIRANEILEAARAEAQRIVDDATAEANEVRLGAMEYTQAKLSEMREFFARSLAADRELYSNLCDSLEEAVYTVDSNINEMQASINLLTGKAVDVPDNAQQPVAPNNIAPANNVPVNNAPANDDQDDFDDDFDDFDDDDDDFLDE